MQKKQNKQQRSQAQQLLCDISDYLKFKDTKQLPESFNPLIQEAVKNLQQSQQQKNTQQQEMVIYTGQESREVEDMILDLNRLVTQSNGKVPKNVKAKITELGTRLAPQAMNLYRQRTKDAPQQTLEEEKLQPFSDTLKE